MFTCLVWDVTVCACVKKRKDRMMVGKDSMRVSKKEFILLFLQPAGQNKFISMSTSLKSWANVGKGQSYWLEWPWWSYWGNMYLQIGPGCCLDDEFSLESFPDYCGSSWKLIDTSYSAEKSGGFSLEIEQCWGLGGWRKKQMPSEAACCLLLSALIESLSCVTSQSLEY